MKIAAVICEFNPFHNGHKYLIDKIKSDHADCVVAIMSGSFVQRGDIAITDKYTRAKAALENGCDLVVELPTVFALSSAQRFAQGGVQIASALGADMLCFGAEDADTSTLSEIADAFDDDEFKEKLKEHLSLGEYYPKAISLALESTYSKAYADVVNKPNNTLAVEYIKAIKDTTISPVAIKRLDVDHDSDKTSENIASATHIRKLIRDNADYSAFTSICPECIADIKNLETTILYKLRTMSKAEIENLPDVGEGLHNRIYDCARSSNSLEELYEALKTKRYTLARLRRIVMCALLGITKDDSNNNAKYIRVLGMNNTGAQALKNCTSLPIIAKVKQDYDKLSADAKEMFDIDARASEVFSLALNIGEIKYKNDFVSQIIKQ